MASYYQPQALGGDIVDVVGLFIPEAGTEISPSSAMSAAQGTSMSRSKANVTPDDISIAAQRNANTFNMCVDAIDYIRKADIKDNRSLTDGRAQLVTPGIWVEAGEAIRRELVHAFTRTPSGRGRVFPTAKDCQSLGLSELDRYNEISVRASDHPIRVDTLLAGGELLRLASQMLDCPDAEDIKQVYEVFSHTSAFRKQSSKEPFYSDIDDVRSAISEVSRAFAKTYKDKTGGDMNELLDVRSQTRERISADAEKLEAARSRAAAQAIEKFEFKTATKSAQQSGAGPSRGRFKEGFPKELSHSHELIEARRRAGMDQTSFGTHVASKSDENTDAATIQEYAATLEKRVHDKATAEGSTGGLSAPTQEGSSPSRRKEILRRMKSKIFREQT